MALLILLLLLPCLAFGQARRTWVLDVVGDSVAVLRLIIPDSSQVLFQSDTLALLITNSDTIPLHNQIIKMPDSANVVNWVDTTLTNGPATDYDLSLKQPLEATLTDIADGTIAENLVNTVNPWADNEIASSSTWNAKTDDSDSTSWLATRSMGKSIIWFYGSDSITGDTWLADGGGTQSSTTIGYPMARAGSVTAVMIGAQCSAQTTGGTVEAEIYINGSDIWDVSTTISGAANYAWSSTQAIDTDQFSANQLIACNFDFTGFVGTIRFIRVGIEVEW